MNPKNSKKPIPKVEIKKKIKNGPKKVEKCKSEKKKTLQVPKVKIEIIDVPSKVIEEPKKLERSNSFFLTRKLSKIFHMSASKENLNKLDEPKSVENNNGGFKFQRSLTLNSIQLKKNYRNTFVEKLGKLSEEKIGDSDKLKKQSSDFADSPPQSPVLLRSQSPSMHRQTLPAGHNYDNFFKQPKLERSDSFISLFRKKVSFVEKKPASMNSNWNVSLQNLQQIDNMVKYDDGLNFVNYDKFNQYEQKLEKQIQYENKLSENLKVINSIALVKKRPKRISYRSDFTKNLDREKNVYRQSIDSNKLRSFSAINDDTNQWSEDSENRSPMDWLSLEDKPQYPYFAHLKQMASSNSSIQPSNNGNIETLANDELQCCRNFWSCGNLSTYNAETIALNPTMLKSKSLTHLDRLQPQINIQSNYDKETLKGINGGCNVPNAKNNTLMASAAPTATTAKKVNISKLTSNLDLCTPCTPTPISSTPTAIIATPPTPLPLPLPLPLSASVVATAQIKKKTSSFLHRDYNRKPILARSQVSSSEYFSVCFTENGFKDKDEIFIAASKGISLGDSLRQAMVQRNLNFDHICVIDYGLNNSNELGIPQYSGPLEPNIDISILAGHSLFVTERESSNKKSGHYVLQKAASVGYRTRHGKLFTSVSTEDNIESNETTIKNLLTSKQPPKQRWSLQLFGVKNPQQNQLCELLNNFMKNGVPKSNASHIINFEYSDALETLDGLPQSWNDFINASEMTDTDSKIQSAIWELVTTEVDYIYAIQTVTDLFLACLEAIQSENLLCDVDQHKLFSNIRDICDANLKLWSLYFYPMVKHSIATGHPMCIDYFGQGFTNFSSIFEPYTKYCAEQSTCQFYCKELNRSNSLFTAYLAWCEAQKECNRLRLADILVRPMQRLTKYNLLLSAIRKNISEETDSEIMDAMIHSVEDFVCSVNAHLTTRQENERLKGIMARIDAYDVVDSNNEHLEKVIRQYSVMFDLCAPMKGCLTSQGRYLFLEGDMKYKDNISKSDVHCFLLTDIFLVCKQTAKKVHSNLKVIRQPFMTDRIVVQLKEKDNTLHCVYLNEFNMVIAGFTLQCNEAKNWYEGFVKAKHIYTRLKQGSPFMDSIKFPSTNAHSNMSHTNQNHTAISSSNNINVIDNTSIKKSPLGSSIGSRVSSLNNSHSGSVELTESKAVSIDFDKTNSMSSDEGSSFMKLGFNTAGTTRKLRQTSSNSLTVQPFSNHLGQSMPNLCGHIANNPYINNNTLLVPGSTKSHSAHSSHSGNLLSPSQRGISYPPPSPTRATLRRGFAFSSSIKNPPLIKSRNITSQSFNCNQQQQQQQQNLILGTTNQSHSTSVQVAIELQPDNASMLNEPEENCTDT